MKTLPASVLLGMTVAKPAPSKLLVGNALEFQETVIYGLESGVIGMVRAGR